MYLFGNFVLLYFFHLPLQHNFFSFPNRLLARYVTLSETNTLPIKIYSPTPKAEFQQYLFYSNAYNKNTVSAVAQAMKTNKFILGNISFLSCNSMEKKLDRDALILIHANCKNRYRDIHLTLPQLSDSGEVYAIYNDHLCQDWPLKRYANQFTFPDLSVEKLSASQFCQTFITNPNQ